jgi:competence protein ComEC
MTLHFYDVGQALSVLVDLPDGRHVLVDAADTAHREGCGDVCARAQAHLLDRLRTDLHGAPLDMLWITHQHSDHIGGAPEVLASFPVALYVDNGRDGHKGEVRRAREAAAAHGAQVRVVDPDHPDPPLRGSPDVGLVPVVPAAWPRSCASQGGDENECSIALRIDDCRSSVLLTGDAEHEEEKLLDPGRPVTLLQVGHHGSDTSSSPAFLARTRPLYAVISAGKQDEGLNRDYCHPRASVVQRLSRVLDADAADAGLPGASVGSTGATLDAFDGTRCDRATPADWVAAASSDRLWATERDGDVVLVTTGDGVFRRR